METVCRHRCLSAIPMAQKKLKGDEVDEKNVTLIVQSDQVNKDVNEENMHY